MTQDDYKLWTGDDTTFADSDWTKIVAVASSRLCSFLCLDALTDPIPDALMAVLANFICAMVRFRGNNEPAMASKSIRNFSVSFQSDTATTVFAQVAQNYRDLIDTYSNCDSSIVVESDYPEIYDNDRL